MANNRTKGHKYERKLAKQLRENGFPHVVTSRSESKSRDDAKVDLMNKDEWENGRLPFNPQLKSVSRILDYPEILNEMPDIEGIENVIFHEYTQKKGKVFRVQGNYAICSTDFMLELLNLKYGSGI